MNPEIFRAYDIRGVYNEDFDEETAYYLGRAFVRFLKKPELNIVVGRDDRLSSPALHKKLVKGILEEGANVIDIGLATTPLMYFAVAHYGFDGGINITASHNPKSYNGFKIVREKAIPVGGENGLKEICGLMSSHFENKKKGRIKKRKIISDYVDFNLKPFKDKNFLKIVVDSSNAVTGIIMPELKKRLKSKIYPLFWKLDGNFPNHSPDPLEKKNLRFVKEEVLKKKADLGVAFDGDGDRIIFVDEKGRDISGDIITAFLSVLILKDNPKEKIIYDIRSSRIVEEAIQKNGGVPIANRIGHSFIKGRMRKENVIFAGELSGHYYHRDHYFCESPLFVFLKVLEELTKTKKPISELVKPYQKYFYSGEINFKVKEKKGILAKLEERYKEGKISRLDGLRVDFKDWWFNIRPSNTEPLLRLIIESEKEEVLEQKKKEISEFITSF